MEKVKRNTNLSRRKGWSEVIRKVTLGDPRSDIQQRTNGEKSARLDQHRVDEPAQPVDRGWSPHCVSDDPDMDDESDNDHGRKEDIERKGNRNIEDAERGGASRPIAIAWLRVLEEKHDSHSYISDG